MDYTNFSPSICLSIENDKDPQAIFVQKKNHQIKNPGSHHKYVQNWVKFYLNKKSS